MGMQQVPDGNGGTVATPTFNGDPKNPQSFNGGSAQSVGYGAQTGLANQSINQMLDLTQGAPGNSIAPIAQAVYMPQQSQPITPLRGQGA